MTDADYPTPIRDVNPPRAGTFLPNPTTTISLHSPKLREYKPVAKKKRKRK